MTTKIPYTEIMDRMKSDIDYIAGEAYDKGYSEGSDAKFRRLTGSEYQHGLTDAWECARKICLTESEGGLSGNTVCNIFNTEYYRDALRDYTPAEAIEKIRQYEQKKEEQEKEEIQVGDEVKAFERKPFIVTGFRYGDEGTVYCHGFVTENGISTLTKKDECVKTGRHFPEIAEALKKMREE